MPSADDVKTWYNQHYAAKGLQSMRPAAAYPVFLDLLEAKAGGRLFDVSCGTGSLLPTHEQDHRSASLAGVNDALSDLGQNRVIHGWNGIAWFKHMVERHIVDALA